MKYQYFTLATVIKPYLLSFIFFFAAQIMAIAQVPTPTIALTTDTGSSSTDGITNDASVNISGLNVGSFYEFSRDGGVTWVPLGLASGASATFSALSTFSSGTLDSNPTISKTAPSTSVEATLEPYSSGDSPDSFYFDVTMPATFGTDSEILFESGAIGVGASIFVEGADLKISIGSDNNASDLSATGVFETNKRYGIIVELLTDKSVKFYVIEKGGQLPSSFGVAIAASASGLWDSRWSGANGAGWGYYDGLEQAQGSSTNNYAGFSGTFHEGMFFDQKGFSDIWTDGSQGNDLTVLDNVEVVARQTIENSGKSTVSNPLTITYDETPPSITSSATATSIDENSGASQVIYTVITDETATYSLGTAGGDESAFSIDGITGEVTLTADPDYETKSSYSFEVVATDAAGNASQQTVTLAINDLDDQPSTTVVGIEDNQTDVIVSGIDDFVNGTYSLVTDTSSLIFSSDFVPFSSDPSVIDTGKPVYSYTNADGETWYIWARETGYHISQLNDSSKWFWEDDFELASSPVDVIRWTRSTTAAPDQFSVPEQNAAVNNDTANSAVTYTITFSSAVDGNTFDSSKVKIIDTNEVDITTGWTIGEPTDSGDGMIWTVEVTPPANTEAAIRLKVEVSGIVDADGNTLGGDFTQESSTQNFDTLAPAFTSGTTATAIDENSGSDQIVYTVTADETATYSLGSAGGDESAFSIDGTTGEVTLTADPDYETKSSYSFEVVATDAAGNASQQTVTLAINDLNDNAPVFSSGSTVSVAEGQTATGYTAAATDADAGSTIGYTITGGLDHTLFDIDQTSGELTFKVAPDYEAPSDSDEDNAYVVEVEATDGLHGTTQTVTVTVTDIVDEMAPMLDTVEASSDGGQIILTLTESVVENGTVNASDFVLTIDNVDSPPTVTNITVSTSTVSLTLSEALSIAPGTNITLTYTKSGDSGTIEDSVGNRLADFSQQSVDIGTLEFKVATKAEILFNNPVRTSLHITSDEKLYQLRIFSINGRKVLEKGLNTNSQSVDLSTLPAGIYLLELATETHVKRGKLLKM